MRVAGSHNVPTPPRQRFSGPRYCRNRSVVEVTKAQWRETGSPSPHQTIQARAGR